MIEEGDRIAVGVDARDGYVAVSGWKELSAEKGVDFCRRLRDAGVQTVIYTDISRDGAEQGTNLALYRELAKIEGLDITASGGVSSMEDAAASAAATPSSTGRIPPPAGTSWTSCWAEKANANRRVPPVTRSKD